MTSGTSIARLAPALGLFAGTAAAAAPISPIVEFLGQRFYLSDAGIPASQDIAFRRSDQTILTGAGHVMVCGGAASAAQGDQGIAVDPVTDEFWFVTNTGDVRRITDEGGMSFASERVFLIPDEFTVPGVGVQTVHSPRGLALDDTHVYVVDAGPDLGEPTSNAWFKFERDGTPVSSSALTDFTDHLDFGFDSVVDGIAWLPPDAPYAAGLFLVAVEHSGIVVIDADGFFVTRIDWDEVGLPAGVIPFAFSGVAMDPDTGDLYLVENAGSLCQVWNRLPSEPVPVLYAAGGGRLQVFGPDARCRRSLSYPVPEDPVFGLAYQPESGLLFAAAYNTGEMFAVDPRAGISTSVGTSMINVWGLDWDPSREVFFAARSGQLYTIDPVTYVADPLPSPIGYFTTDIAYNPDTDRLNAIVFIPARDDARGGDTWLIEIDPVTGAGAPVVTTVSGDGIAYDPDSGSLITIVRGSSHQFHAVDPSSGVAMPLPQYGTPTYWEALAIVPGESTLLGTPSVTPPTSRVTAVRAIPNPTRAATSFLMPPSLRGPVRMTIVDAAGRRVDAVGVSRVDGRGSVTWDARDAGGRPIPSGIYYVDVATPGGRARGRVMVLR